MKNVLLFIAIVSAIVQGYSQIIPNNSFEQWKTNSFPQYEEPLPWNTTNPYTSLVGQPNVTKSEDAFDGSYSARLETVEIQVSTYTFYAPGVLTFADFNINFATQQYSFGGGLPLQTKVSRLDGKFKYQSVENDSASVLIYCYRHPEGEAIDTIGVGLAYLHDAENWTDFSVYMQYFNDHTPDSFNVLLLSSGTFQLGYMPPGSVLYVDDISVDTTFSAVKLNPSQQAKIYPNPTSGKLYIEISNNINEGMLSIYDMIGNIAKEVDFSGSSVITDVGNLPNGVYTYKITDQSKIPITGTFVKH